MAASKLSAIANAQTNRNFWKAEAEKETALMKRLAREKEEGNLVPRDEVVAAEVGRVVELKNALLTLCSTCAETVSGQGHPAECFETIWRETRVMLERFASSASKCHLNEDEVNVLLEYIRKEDGE